MRVIHRGGTVGPIEEYPPGLGVAGSGVGGVWDLLFGKPQSWYDNIGRIQRELSSLNAGVGAYPKDRWEQLYHQLESIKQVPGATPPLLFTGYGWTRGEILQQLKNIVATEEHVPTDGAINFADQRAKQIAAMLEFAQKVMRGVDPGLASEVDAARRDMEARVGASTRLRSPAEVGRETFVKTLEERADLLLGSTGTIVKYAAIAVVAAAGIYIVSKVL